MKLPEENVARGAEPWNWSHSPASHRGWGGLRKAGAAPACSPPIITLPWWGLWAGGGHVLIKPFFLESFIRTGISAAFPWPPMLTTICAVVETQKTLIYLFKIYKSQGVESRLEFQTTWLQTSFHYSGLAHCWGGKLLYLLRVFGWVQELN